MESNFKKISNTIKDLDSIKEISDDEKFRLIGYYTEQLMKNVELKKELKELEKKNKEVETQLWI